MQRSQTAPRHRVYRQAIQHLIGEPLPLPEKYAIICIATRTESRGNLTEGGI